MRQTFFHPYKRCIALCLLCCHLLTLTSCGNTLTTNQPTKAKEATTKKGIGYSSIPSKQQYPSVDKGILTGNQEIQPQQGSSLASTIPSHSTGHNVPTEIRSTDSFNPNTIESAQSQVEAMHHQGNSANLNNPFDQNKLEFNLTPDGSVYVAQDGHQVNLVMQAERLVAQVEENLPIGFSRSHTLPVYIAPGFLLNNLKTHDKDWHARHIMVVLPERSDDGKGYVYIGSRAILGGVGKKGAQDGCNHSWDEKVQNPITGKWECPGNLKHPREDPKETLPHIEVSTAPITTPTDTNFEDLYHQRRWDEYKRTHSLDFNVDWVIPPLPNFLAQPSSTPFLPQIVNSSSQGALLGLHSLPNTLSQSSIPPYRTTPSFVSRTTQAPLSFMNQIESSTIIGDVVQGMADLFISAQQHKKYLAYLEERSKIEFAKNWEQLQEELAVIEKERQEKNAKFNQQRAAEKERLSKERVKRLQERSETREDKRIQELVDRRIAAEKEGVQIVKLFNIFLPTSKKNYLESIEEDIQCFQEDVLESNRTKGLLQPHQDSARCLFKKINQELVELQDVADKWQYVKDHPASITFHPKYHPEHLVAAKQLIKQLNDHKATLRKILTDRGEPFAKYEEDESDTEEALLFYKELEELLNDPTDAIERRDRIHQAIKDSITKSNGATSLSCQQDARVVAQNIAHEISVLCGKHAAIAQLYFDSDSRDTTSRPITTGLEQLKLLRSCIHELNQSLFEFCKQVDIELPLMSSQPFLDKAILRDTFNELSYLKVPGSPVSEEVLGNHPLPKTKEGWIDLALSAGLNYVSISKRLQQQLETHHNKKKINAKVREFTGKLLNKELKKVMPRTTTTTTTTTTSSNAIEQATRSLKKQLDFDPEQPLSREELQEEAQNLLCELAEDIRYEERQKAACIRQGYEEETPELREMREERQQEAEYNLQQLQIDRSELLKTMSLLDIPVEKVNPYETLTVYFDQPEDATKLAENGEQAVEGLLQQVTTKDTTALTPQATELRDALSSFVTNIYAKQAVRNSIYYSDESEYLQEQVKKELGHLDNSLKKSKEVVEKLCKTFNLENPDLRPKPPITKEALLSAFNVALDFIVPNGSELLKIALGTAEMPKDLEGYAVLAANIVIGATPIGKVKQVVKLLKNAAKKVTTPVEKMVLKEMEKQVMKEARVLHRAAKKARQHEKLVEKAGKNSRNTIPQTGNYIHAPETPSEMLAFPDLERVRRKTHIKGGGSRVRWKDKKGNIYEWDSQHGAFEKYNKRGQHLGEFNKDTGVQLKPADPTRSIEP